MALVCVLLLPVLAVAAGALTGELDERGAGGLNWISLAYSVWEGFMCLAMVITVLAWFRQRFNHQGRLVRAMSEASFAVYVLHPIIIVSLALVAERHSDQPNVDVSDCCAPGGGAVLHHRVLFPQAPAGQKYFLRVRL